MFLENAENIVLIENGKVSDQGKFKDLVENGKNTFLEKLKHESSTDDLNPEEPGASEDVKEWAINILFISNLETLMLPLRRKANLANHFMFRRLLSLTNVL